MKGLCIYQAQDFLFNQKRMEILKGFKEECGARAWRYRVDKMMWSSYNQGESGRAEHLRRKVIWQDGSDEGAFFSHLEQRVGAGRIEITHISQPPKDYWFVKHNSSSMPLNSLMSSGWKRIQVRDFKEQARDGDQGAMTKRKRLKAKCCIIFQSAFVCFLGLTFSVFLCL